MADESMKSFEPILEKLGMPGRFQITHVVMAVLAKTFMVFMTVSFVFLGFNPPHVCNRVNETRLLQGHQLLNDTSAIIGYTSCEVVVTSNSSSQVRDIKRIDCPNGRNFSNAKATTLLSDWDLVCESRGVAEWSQTIFILGQIVGGLVNSDISDRFGRKPVFLVSGIAVLMLESSLVIAPSIYMFYAIKLFSGFAYQGFLASYFVHNMELFVPRHRPIYGVVVCYHWVTSLLLIGGAAFLLRDHDWRYLQGFVAATGLITLVFPFLFYESPRWLAAKGRLKEVLAVMKKACEQNKKDFGEIKQMVDDFVKLNSSRSDQMVPLNSNESDSGLEGPDDNITFKKQSALTLFQNRCLLKITLITWYTWLTCNLTYYGLYMTSSSIAGNRFLNYTLMVLVEIPSNLVLLIMLKKISRRVVLMIFMALSAASLLTSSLFLTFIGQSGAGGHISTALFIIGKFAIGSAFNTVFIITPELYPTKLRATGNGLCSSLGRIGSMIAPFFRPLFEMAPWAPGVIFTVMCLVALLLIPRLPETKDRDLPNDIQSIQQGQEKRARIVRS